MEGSRWKGLGRRNFLSSTSTPQIVATDRYTPEADITGVIDEIRSNHTNDSNEGQQQPTINGKRAQLAGALVIQMSYTSSSTVNADLLSRLFTLDDFGSDDPTLAGQRLWLHAAKSVVDMHGGNIRAFPLSDRVPGGAASGVSIVIELPMTRIVDVSNASRSNSLVQSSSAISSIKNGQELELASDQLLLSQPLHGTTTNAHSNLNHPVSSLQASLIELVEDNAHTSSEAIMTSQPQSGIGYGNGNNTTLPVNDLGHGHNYNNNHSNDRCTSEIDRVSILSPSDIMSSITLPLEVREYIIPCLTMHPLIHRTDTPSHNRALFYLCDLP